jgi:hypothetical protein
MRIDLLGRSFHSAAATDNDGELVSRAVADWATLSAVGTAAGTLVLAGATFASVRSANRAARVAERSLLVGLRPVLVPSRPGDATAEVQFADGHVLALKPGRATVARIGEVIYLAVSLRNVGSGLAVLRGYRLEGTDAERAAQDPLGRALHLRGGSAPDPEDFRPQQRDLYVPAGDVGFWQAALRDPADALHASLREAIATNGRITVDLHYSDHEVGQPAITRFVLLQDEGEGWRAEVARHWSLF